MNNTVFNILVLLVSAGLIYISYIFAVKIAHKDKEKKDEWKYHECNNCYVLWPHLAVPEICVCGNDMKKNYNKKTLKIIEFAAEVNDDE